MATAKKKVKLKANIKHGDSRYKSGETISVTKTEYEELAKAGVIDEG